MNRPDDDLLMGLFAFRTEKLCQQLQHPRVKDNFIAQSYKWMYISVRLKWQFDNGAVPFPKKMVMVPELVNYNNLCAEAFDEIWDIKLTPLHHLELSIEITEPVTIYAEYLFHLWNVCFELNSVMSNHPSLEIFSDEARNPELLWLYIIWGRREIEWIRDNAQYFQLPSISQQKEFLREQKNNPVNQRRSSGWYRTMERMKLDQSKRKANTSVNKNIEETTGLYSDFENILRFYSSKMNPRILSPYMEAERKYYEWLIKNAQSYHIINGQSVVNPSKTGRKPKKLS